MPEEAPGTLLRLVLAGDEGIGRVTVELESFVQFNQHMTDELAKFDQQHSHLTFPRTADHRSRGAHRKAK